MGHRISVDLDLFNLFSFDESKLIQKIENRFNFRKIALSESTINCLIEYPRQSKNMIKVDFIKFALSTSQSCPEF